MSAVDCRMVEGERDIKVRRTSRREVAKLVIVWAAGRGVTVATGKQCG